MKEVLGHQSLTTRVSLTQDRVMSDVSSDLPRPSLSETGASNEPAQKLSAEAPVRINSHAPEPEVGKVPEEDEKDKAHIADLLAGVRQDIAREVTPDSANPNTNLSTPTEATEEIVEPAISDIPPGMEIKDPRLEIRALRMIEDDNLPTHDPRYLGFRENFRSEATLALKDGKSLTEADERDISKKAAMAYLEDASIRRANAASCFKDVMPGFGELTNVPHGIKQDADYRELITSRIIDWKAENGEDAEMTKEVRQDIETQVAREIMLQKVPKSVGEDRLYKKLMENFPKVLDDARSKISDFDKLIGEDYFRQEYINRVLIEKQKNKNKNLVWKLFALLGINLAKSMTNELKPSLQEGY